MKKRLLAALATITAASAWAHGGHGMPGDVHWHATDVAGLAVVGMGALLALWLAGRE